MMNIDDYTEIKECLYKGEHYSVRDNGAVLRHPKEGKKPRAIDNEWTFGVEDTPDGCLMLGGHKVHCIVATAFYGAKDGRGILVKHLDGDITHNSPYNLRWVTRVDMALEDQKTRQNVITACGSLEAFYDKPALLYGHESLAETFYWMRKLTPEQARGVRVSSPKASPKSSSKETLMDILDKQAAEYLKIADAIDYPYTKQNADTMKSGEDSLKFEEEEITKKYPRYKELFMRPIPKYVGMEIFNKNDDPVVRSNMKEASKHLEDMISSTTDGYITITAMDVCFFMKECWKCHLPYDAYFIVRLGLGPNHQMTDFPGSIINPLEPTIVDAVKKYLQEHPELRYLMGEVKSRHSSVVGDNYMSFGCPHCDAIYGDFYLKDDIMEEIYYFSEEDVHHIVFEEGVRIKVK